LILNYDFKADKLQSFFVQVKAFQDEQIVELMDAFEDKAYINLAASKMKGLLASHENCIF